MGIFVYVGNLESSITEDILRKVFVDGGTTVKSVAIMRTPQNDRSRGFGFVEVASEEEVETTISAMNGVEIEGKALKVNTARTATTRSTGRNFQSYGPGGRSSGPRRNTGAKRRSR